MTVRPAGRQEDPVSSNLVVNVLPNQRKTASGPTFRAFSPSCSQVFEKLTELTVVELVRLLGFIVEPISLRGGAGGETIGAKALLGALGVAPGGFGLALTDAGATEGFDPGPALKIESSSRTRSGVEEPSVGVLSWIARIAFRTKSGRDMCLLRSAM